MLILSAMGAMRRCLSCVVAMWLVFQITGIVAPIGIAAAGYMTAEDLCDCPADGHGATCPMHHTRTRQTVPVNDGARHLQNACAPADATLLSMLGGAGVLPLAITQSVELTSEDVVQVTAAAFQRFELPEAPPPRA